LRSSPCPKAKFKRRIRKTGASPFAVEPFNLTFAVSEHIGRIRLGEFTDCRGRRNDAHRDRQGQSDNHSIHRLDGRQD